MPGDRSSRGPCRRLAGFRDLLAFMTGIPLGGGDIERAACAFPLIPFVGALEGLLASLALAVLAVFGVEGVLAGAFYLVVHLLVTGGIHLDGFSDYLDVLGSRLSGEGAVRVLKDPRKGSHAIVWIAATFILSAASAGEIASLASAPGPCPVLCLAVFTAVYTASTEAMYMVLAVGPREPYMGLGGLFKDYMDRADHAVNIAAYTITGLLLALAALHSTSSATILLVVLAAPFPISILAARDASHRLGFVNGDVAGFAYEATRTILLALAAIALHAGAGLGAL
ncbi:MAG: adenosylcobinamide-GDP ribazoletransferase [Desulfurococcales archaeon]|nr:adenosylcobinamide-GDP ribazoletransferase [Desulfurococcales archaeon]